MRVTENQVKKAMKTIFKWAKQNKIRYVDFAFFADQYPSFLNLTYQKRNSGKYENIIIKKGGKDDEAK